jgi:hypothetical protein
MLRIGLRNGRRPQAASASPQRGEVQNRDPL